MAGRNRLNFGRGPGRDAVQYQRFPYGDGAPQQLGPPSRDNGMGGRDSRNMRRGSDLDPFLSRRLPGPSYPGVDPRAGPGRNVQGALGDGRHVSGGRRPLSTEPPIHSGQQNFDAGVSRLPYEQGGGQFMGPGGMGSYSTHPPPMRGGVGGVGAHNYGSVDSYGLLNQQQVQLSDGSFRTMYSVSELGGNVPPEAGMKGLGGFRGGYVGPEALAAAQSQKVPQQGMYPGRQMGRDGRLVHRGGWEEDARFAAPLSPQAMPMSPRRDDMMRMMSPRRDDLTSPMSPRRDDYPHMMSPRREDISPPRSPRRREYPPVVDYGGRLQPRRGFSPSREEEFYLPPHVDFPMSPRRISPPMSPRGGWDYDGPPVSPPRLVPMSPRRETLTRSPVWGRSRHSAKGPSQWDVLPGKSSAWNGESDRQSRRDSRRSFPRGAVRNVGFGADTADPKIWPPSRRDEGRFRRGRDYEDMHNSRGAERSFDDHAPHPFGMANNRPNAYNSVVNQRVGLVTKYIERERAERAAKDSTDGTFKDSSSKKMPADSDRPPADSTRPVRSDRRNEKDTLAAAIAKTTASLSKHVSSSAKKPSKPERSSTGPAASSGGKPAAAPASNTDRTGGGEETTGSEPPAAIVSETPAAPETPAATANGTAAAGSSGPPSTVEVAKDSNQETKKDSKTPSVAGTAVTETPSVAGTAVTEDAAAAASEKNSVDDNSGHQSNGPPNTSANGNTNTDSKIGGDQQTPAKRPSLVMEIERATKSRKLAEQQKHVNSREVEETYYDANELSAEFVTKMNKAGSRYSRMINDDSSLKRRYEGGGAGGQGGLHCLVCGKGSSTYSDIYELVTHAQQSQVQSKRIDHMGFRKALIDVLKLDVKEPAASNVQAEDDAVVWPPIVVVENTRTGMGADRRWEGLTNSEMAVLLNELGHLHGRAKSIWDKFGHRGIVHVEFEPTLDGLREAERLHNYFLQSGRGRVQWDIIRPFQTGLPGFETVPEGPDFTLYDEASKTTRRVLYGYLALKKDIENIFSKKQRKKVQVANRKAVTASLLANPSGEQVEVI